jgi:diapolycopene oxygenase
MDAQKIGIIGSGIGGLASAIRMASRGYRVEVFEAQEVAGGKAGEVRRDGFRFDTGPSLFTMPELLESLWNLADTPSENRVKYTRLPEVCRYVYPDGTTLTVPSDPEEFAMEMEQVLGEPAENTRRYLRGAAKLYNLTANLFIFSPFQKLSVLFDKRNAGILRQLGILRAHQRMHTYHRKAFNDPRVIQLFDRYATYNGSSPFKAPATLHMISHLEHNLGAWFPEGGMRSVVNALWREAERLGVTFHMNTPVKEITLQGKRATGVLTTREEHHLFDHIISNADICNTYGKLLPTIALPRAIRRQQLSSSALIFLWGINRSNPETSLHNILFSKHYRDEFRHLFNRTTPIADPTVYIYISQKNNPADAPSGCENWFVMVNTPPDQGQYTPEVIQQIRQQILQKISQTLGISVTDHLITEEVITPATIAQRTGAFRGALYGPSSNSMWSAFLRHPNYHRRIQNLWFAGGSVHPGGGIPLCLASAYIVDRLIAEEE